MDKFLLTLLATAIVVAAPAAATTVNFTPLVAGGANSIVSTYDESGFRFYNLGTRSAGGLFNWGTSFSASSADPTGGVLVTNFGYRGTKVSKVDGSLFDFASVDLTDYYNDNVDAASITFPDQVTNQLNTKDVKFNFLTGSGSTTQTISIDSTPGLQTFTFNKTGLISFVYIPQTTRGGFIQADNFVFDTAGAVPEPASWAMLIAGFGLTGAAMRRRRVAVACA
jgi:hypothetical protein